MAERIERVPWWPAVVAAAISLVTDAWYLVMIWGERDDYLSAPRIFHDELRELYGNPFNAGVVFFAGAILALSAAAVLGRAWHDRPAGIALAWGSASGLVGIGIVGIWSIGVPLLVAAAFAISSAVACTAMTTLRRGTLRAALVGTLSTLALLAAGVAATLR
jgi:hypothetical protein